MSSLSTQASLAVPAPSRRRITQRKRLEDAMKFMRANFQRTPRVRDLAEGVGLSPFYFHREFTRHFGITPKQVLLELQIAKAQRLMLRGVPLAKVATTVGFVHHSHFTVRFKQLVGKTPSRWLREQRGQQQTTTEQSAVELAQDALMA